MKSDKNAQTEVKSIYLPSNRIFTIFSSCLAHERKSLSMATLRAFALSSSWSKLMQDPIAKSAFYLGKKTSAKNYPLTCTPRGKKKKKFLLSRSSAFTRTVWLVGARLFSGKQESARGAGKDDRLKTRHNARTHTMSLKRPAVQRGKKKRRNFFFLL